MAIDPKQVQAAFLEAIAAKPEERAAVLDRICTGDDELRRRVEMLVRAHDDSGELPAAGEVVDTISFEPKAAPPAALQPGCLFAGRYKLREKLGEGGMGIVWVADQTAPVQRRIALKVIKSTDDSRRLLARFEQERQALALMDHPHIAKVFDAGVSDDGRPYFAMELIKGVPLTKYCDEAKLTPKERLELFVPVCQAVQHAHQKGIIHRDLKPSNILVGLYDGRPVPKVIDFGVAKATGPQLSEQSIYTEVGTMIGTVEYMSPEQAELNNLDIDTRSDIYALGVILYELLTGGVPFSRKEMKAAGFAEMLRLFKEVEPPKPSTRLSGSGTLPSVAACRHTEPNQLTRLVRGELDWIVMKCLEKDRSRRYETANGLSMEIQRYLANQPVEAGPPSATYRLRKFVRRNRPQVIAVSLVLLALLAGIAGTSWGLVEARTQRDRAEQARAAEADRAEGERVARVEAQAAEKLAGERLLQVNAEKKKAEENLQVARAVQDFLQNKLLRQADVFSQADSLLQAGGLAAETRENPTIRELLDRAAKELTPDKIDANFASQPLVQAEILGTVGITYANVGEFERGISFLQRALALNRQLRASDDSETLKNMENLAFAYMGAYKMDLALPLYEDALRLTKIKHGPEHPETLEKMRALGEAYRGAQKLELALPLLEKTFKLTVDKFGSEDPRTFHIRANLGLSYLNAEKWNMALPLFEENLKLRNATLGPENPQTLVSIDNLGSAYLEAGNPGMALPLLLKGFELSKAMNGVDNFNTLMVMSSLAKAQSQAGSMDLALQLGEEALKLSKTKYGRDYPDTLSRMSELAMIYMSAKKTDQAVPLLEEAVKLWKARPGFVDRNKLIAMQNLACIYAFDVGKPQLAMPLFEETLKLEKETLGPDNLIIRNTLGNFARAYQILGKPDLAAPLFKEVLVLIEAKFGSDHPQTLGTMHNLAVAYQDAGKRDLALLLFKKNFGLTEAKLGPDDPQTLLSMYYLALAYQAAGKLDLAVPLFKEMLAKGRKVWPKDSPGLAGYLASVASSLLQAKAFPEAEPLLRECLAIREKAEPDAWTTFNTKSLLGGSLLGQRKYVNAAPLLLAGYEGMKKREQTIQRPAKFRLTEAVERLMQFYEAMDNKDEAGRWRLERDKYLEASPKPQEKK